ncbi:MAG: ABC transporter ATP-binding protein [Burkholderiales bacterium]|nr:ABC transporter ATP-binding protein [Phycisphaerae bacterium]
MKPAISVENISKAYRIGMAEQNESFGATIKNTLRNPLKVLRKFNENYETGDDVFWALRDVSFDVERGEVVGLIGRNGAGKSTLLKVLSRIVEPTGGQAVMRGRVSSLLEVGTGFHPELTGRENIFLNGAILGMKQSEIRRKFDQIVEFSEVGQFLDTQVKRYSSGMYVRLAFSVAAHLDPEIMIVDEVLAVGDQAFQQKCLGKMNDVMRQGRTILFVSHSMDAVASLCTTVVHVKKGTVSAKVPVEQGIRAYLDEAAAGDDLPLKDKPRTQKDKGRRPIFHDMTISTDAGESVMIPVGARVKFDVLMKDFSDIPGNLTLGIGVSNSRGQRVALFHTEYHKGMTFRGADEMTITCDIPSLPLAPASYTVDLVLADGYNIIERIERAATIEVVFSDILGTGKVPNGKQSTVVLPCVFSN